MSEKQHFIPTIEERNRRIELERTGHLLVRWRGRVTIERRWKLYADHNSAWKVEHARPIRRVPGLMLGNPYWIEGFTEKGVRRQLERLLRKEDAQRQRERERRQYDAPIPKETT